MQTSAVAQAPKPLFQSTLGDSVTSLKHLPRDVLLMILRLLSLSDRFNTYRTCRGFKWLIDSDDAIVKYFQRIFQPANVFPIPIDSALMPEIVNTRTRLLDCSGPCVRAFTKPIVNPPTQVNCTDLIDLIVYNEQYALFRNEKIVNLTDFSCKNLNFDDLTDNLVDLENFRIVAAHFLSPDQIITVHAGFLVAAWDPNSGNCLRFCIIEPEKDQRTRSFISQSALLGDFLILLRGGRHKEDQLDILNIKTFKTETPLLGLTPTYLIAIDQQLIISDLNNDLRGLGIVEGKLKELWVNSVAYKTSRRRVETLNDCVLCLQEEKPYLKQTTLCARSGDLLGKSKDTLTTFFEKDLVFSFNSQNWTLKISTFFPRNRIAALEFTAQKNIFTEGQFHLFQINSIQLNADNECTICYGYHAPDKPPRYGAMIISEAKYQTEEGKN